MMRRLLDMAAATKLVGWYDQLERRDQLVVLSLGAFVLGVVLLFGIWQPLARYVDEGLSGFERNQELLAWMRSTETQARRMAGVSNAQQRSGQSLLTLVSRSARSEGIKANKLQPEGTDTVSVWCDAVAFNDLIRWLEKLAAEQEVQVHQISISRFDQPGTVNVRIVLRG